MKRYIYVAGFDYEFKGVDFRIFANNRMKRRINANNAKDELEITILDVARGEVVINTVTYPGGKKQEAQSKTRPFSAISKSDYDKYSGHIRFKPGQRDKMSILDVYAAVQKIGKSDPGSLFELSFFSHAWHGGVILVNSDDDGQATTFVGGVEVNTPLVGTSRDPDDMDPRPAKDFIAPTMDAAQLDEFKKAFAKDAVIWSWGCTFPEAVHVFLHALETHPKYKASGVADDEVFTFKNLDTEAANLIEIYLKSVLRGPFPDKKNISLKFKFIKYYFCLLASATYMHHMAVNSGVTVFGANVGTYAEYDSGYLPLMNVSSTFTRHFAFYKNYFGFTFDPEGRRYAAYTPTFSCTAPAP